MMAMVGLLETCRRHVGWHAAAAAVLVLGACGGGGSQAPASDGGPDFYVFAMNEPLLENEASILTSVRLEFTGDIDATSIRAGDFELSTGGQVVATDLAVSGRTVTITPRSRLRAGTVYDVNVRGALRSLSGKPLAWNFYRAFVTERLPLRSELLHPFASIGNGGPLALGDFDGDGRVDIARALPSPARLLIYRGLAGGQFAAPVAVNLPMSKCPPTALEAADMDADGRTDLVVGAYLAPNDNNGGCGVDVVRQAPGGLLSAVLHLTNTHVRRLGIADMNGDGLPDIVGTGVRDTGLGAFQTGLAIWLNDASGGFAEPTEYRVDGNGTAELRVSDFDDDGRADVLTWTALTPPTQQLWLQQVSGLLAPPLSLQAASVPGAAAAPWSGAVALDGDADGRTDIVVTTGGNIPGASVVVYSRVAGGAAFTQGLRLPAYENPSVPAVADVDGDGRRDLVLLHAGWAALSIYHQRGAQGLQRVTRYALPFQNIEINGLSLWDFNVDGLVDMALADPSGLYLISQVPQ